METNKKITNIVKWMDQYLTTSKAKGFVFGVSGGIDSALIAAICAKYFPTKSKALIMNIENSNEDIEDANLVVKQTGINFEDINLLNIYLDFKKLFTNQTLLSLGNLKSRLRGITLYNFAQINSYLVIGTSNADEFYTGYFTKYGDSACDLLPIVNLTKKEVYECAAYLNIPQKILDKKPSAGLYQNQFDEDDLKVTYNEIDNFLLYQQGSEDSKKRILTLHENTNHKRNLPESPLPKNKFFK